MELYLKSDWKKIGISLSGGADSALLSFLICSNSTAEIHFTNQIRMWRTRPWQEYIADQVIDWFKKRFKNKFYLHRNLIPPELEEPRSPLIEDEYGKMKPGNRIILRSHNEYIAKKYKLNAIYAGLNKNPDITIPGELEDRNEVRLSPFYVHNGTAICHPFINITKDKIIKEYYKYNILDLLDLTRSCEGEFENINYLNYKPGQYIPLCGECFWCKEREWAIEQNK
jgi:tRNA(Ile)-lysidine synthase TilS/MesJ